MKLSIGNGRVRLFRNPIAILMMATVIAGSGFVVAAKAEAAKVTWTLTNVTFDDGGIATGTFDFDAATSTISDWMIDVSGGDETTFPP